jgi:outer membrane protein OmpA-like peptidoglycan-associated protein
MGIRIPFVGGEALATRGFLVKVMEWENAKNIKKTIIPTIFNPLLRENQAFMALYEKSYPNQKYWPEQNAALGYDNIMLLAHAIKRAQSTVPARVADSLRYMQACRGIAGNYQFSENGELLSKPFYFRSLHKGRYEFYQHSDAKNKPSNDIEICNKIDRDKDSIPNDLDTCPDNTANELSKGIIKTGLLRGCPIDTDQDKIEDYEDKCPKNTFKEISKSVNEEGCPLDSDADGTPDYKDACPHNPELIAFIKGKNCTEDKDGDDVTDDIDQCPNNTKEEIAKGVNKKGCPIDTDQDTLVDYLDKCPKNTPKEISQGIDNRGCSADNDQDTILDYLDKCLKTPINVEIDEQGCGIFQKTLLLQAVNLYFESGKIILTTNGKAYLKTLLREINPERLKQIKITVHTDNRGDSDKNQALSDDRAATLANYLMDQGIEGEKIFSEGKGASIPITDNKTPKNRQQNRRLEIILMQFKTKISTTIPAE